MKIFCHLFDLAARYLLENSPNFVAEVEVAFLNFSVTELGQDYSNFVPDALFKISIPEKLIIKVFSPKGFAPA